MSRPQNIGIPFVALGIALITATSSSNASEVDSIAEAFTQGKAHVDFRYRYEQVDQDSINNKANASTLRTRLNFNTATLHGVDAFIEADNVSYLGDDRFNNTRNGEVNYPVVADPDGTDINQAYINLKTEPANFRLGRQRINRDNQRFVGGVAWRQNEQTFDAFEISSRSFENSTFHYAYVNKVSTIFGPDDGSPAETLDSDAHFLNATFNTDEIGHFSFYAYSLDFDNAATISNQTIGARYSKTFSLESIKLPLTVEYANQGDHGENTASYSANYYLAALSAKLDKASFGLGYEVLEGSDAANEAFQTPLATLHKFQGWADKFLTTPAGGIEDAYVSASYQYGKSTLAAVFHRFEAETGSANYGSEWDVSWGYKLNEHYGVLAKVAHYDADDFSTDTTKLWLMFTAKF